MSPARGVLERLLRRGQAAHRRGQIASLSMTSERDAGEYLKLRPLADIEAFHTEIALAERSGAITAERDRQGDGARLRRVSIADLPVLAQHLGQVLFDQQADMAEQLLHAWLPQFPVITQVLKAWREGRKVRGHDAQAMHDLADAAHAVTARQAHAGNERILRRESVRLFGHSKRLEKLTPWLDLLLAGELTASGLMPEEIWALLDLRREPQPLLISGIGTVELFDGMRLPLARPYLGLPAETISTLDSPARCVLSIENLASFHDAAALASQTPDLLLLYSAGMPSPTWRAAYVRLVCALPATIRLCHWGDIDEGGFRIAATLAKAAQQAGRQLHPWKMSPEDIPAGTTISRTPPTASTLSAMRYWAERAGWPDIATALTHRALVLEQESLDPILPIVDFT